MSTQPAVQTPADLFNVPETPRRELAIEVRGLSKAYRIPLERMDTLKERVVHPFDRREYRRLQALDAIDFDVERGEFFGIVGRNGSGKSTLLKLLAQHLPRRRGHASVSPAAWSRSSSSGSASTSSSTPARTSSSTA